MKFKAFLKAVGYVLFYLAMQIIVYIAYGLSYVFKNTEKLTNGDFTQIYTDMIGYILEKAIPATAIAAVLTFFILLIAFKFSNKSLAKQIKLRKPARLLSFWPIPILGVAANLLVETVFMLLPESALEDYAAASSLLDVGNGTVYFLSTILLIPFIEEVIFRGLAFVSLRRAMSFLPAAIISSVIFGVCHGQSLWIIYATLMGFMLTFVFDAYRSLWASFLLHLCFNGTSVVLTSVMGTEAVSISMPAVIFSIAASGAATAFCIYAIIRERKKALHKK